MAQTQETISAAILSAHISKVLGRIVSPKQVRGRARGDSGTPLLARFAAGTKSPYQSHVYTLREADVIGQAFVDANNKRSDKPIKWPTMAHKAAPRPRKGPNTAQAVKTPQRGAQTVTEAPAAPETPSN